MNDKKEGFGPLFLAARKDLHRTTFSCNYDSTFVRGVANACVSIGDGYPGSILPDFSLFGQIGGLAYVHPTLAPDFDPEFFFKLY